MRQKLLFIVICFSVLVFSCDSGETWWFEEYAKLKGISYVDKNTLNIQYVVRDVFNLNEHDDFYREVSISGIGSDNRQFYVKKSRTNPITDKNGIYVINVTVSPDFISGYQISAAYGGKTFSFIVP